MRREVECRSNGVEVGEGSVVGVMELCFDVRGGRIVCGGRERVKVREGNRWRYMRRRR